MEKTSEDGVDNESGLKYALCCMQGWRVEMEDAHSATLTITDLPGWSFFAVFDGHAGSLVAERSSKQLLTAILSTAEFKKVIAEISTNKPAQFIPSREQMVEIEKGIKNGFLTMDKWLFDLPEAKVVDDRSGSTCICCFINQSQIIFANLGDSRGVMFSVRANQNAVVVATLDHKPVLPKERERIINAGGYVMIQRINGSLAVSRALGDFDYKTVQARGPWEQMVSSEPDLYIYDRNTTDQFLILACDGIWDVMSNKDACDLVRSRLLVTKDLRNITCNLIDTCFSKGSRDNMSVIVVVFKGAPKETADARIKEMTLNTVIENKVIELLKRPVMYEVSDIVQYMLTLLEKETISDLPPGGGIYAKRDVIEQACRKLGFQP